MTYKKNFLALSVAIAVMSLTGCGVTPQDEGSGTNKTAKLSGIAVDGYVAGATVYADTNANNKVDAWEPRALTDSQGYFSYNPITLTNYCESDNLAHEKFCLSAPIGHDEVILRITKGFDLTTMEPFTGTLSMRMNITDSIITTPAMTSPITGLLVHMSEAQQAAFYLAEDIEAEDVGKDFLNFSDASTVVDDAERRKLLSLALKTHKVADMIAGRLNLKFDQDRLANPSAEAEGFFGKVEGVSNDASDLVYREIAKLVSDTESVSDILGDAASMELVVENSWVAFSEVITEHNARKTANANEGDAVDGLYEIVPVNSANVTTIANDAFALADLADTLFNDPLVEIVDGNGTSTIDEDVASRIKALDIVSYLMRTDHGAAEKNNAIDMANDSDYLNHLRSDKTDVAGLKNKFISDPGNIVASAADYSTRQSFTDLLGENNDSANLAGFTVSNAAGMAGNSLGINEGEDNVAITFIGATEDPDVTSGTVNISAAMADGIFAASNDDPTAPTEEVDLTGTWEQLDAYTMLMNVEVAGVNQPVIIKPTLDANNEPAYYFDMGGEQGIWVP